MYIHAEASIELPEVGFEAGRRRTEATSERNADDDASSLRLIAISGLINQRHIDLCPLNILIRIYIDSAGYPGRFS